jgi:8-oxo-dGTP pyrophosphatase MutT (NUDIX family)
MGKSRDIGSPVIQAGAVPYRVTASGGIDVLLITNNSGRWIVPKGGIDAGQTAADQAAIEAFEEAGVVEAVIGGEIGFYEYERGGRLHRVRLFAMLVRELAPDWDESHRREREWVALEEAIERVNFDGLRAAMMQVVAFAAKRAAA